MLMHTDYGDDDEYVVDDDADYDRDVYTIQINDYSSSTCSLINES